MMLLVIEANITIESIIDLGYRELSELLHIDLYVGELIIEAVKKICTRKKSQSRYNITL